MTQVSTQGLVNLLAGTELGGRTDQIYKVNFAVPNKLLGKETGGNSSGFSFGIVQLDIANNSQAKKAYAEILADALSTGRIDQATCDRLEKYNGCKRPDLDKTLAASYRQDRALLTDTVFTAASAHAIVDRYTADYVERSLLGAVNNFLSAVESKWGPNTVFAESNPDCYTAITAMASISNRTGGLRGSTRHFENLASSPDTLSVVKARYDSVLGDHWHLIEVGARLYKEGGVF